jgi:hypothetical protein
MTVIDKHCKNKNISITWSWWWCHTIFGYIFKYDTWNDYNYIYRLCGFFPMILSVLTNSETEKNWSVWHQIHYDVNDKNYNIS